MEGEWPRDQKHRRGEESRDGPRCRVIHDSVCMCRLGLLRHEKKKADEARKIPIGENKRKQETKKKPANKTIRNGREMRVAVGRDMLPRGCAAASPPAHVCSRLMSVNG